VVGAPGRVLDLAGSGDLDFRNVRVLILDEADRMLDMGFYPQMKRILKRVPQKRQTLMFSATIPSQVSRLASVCMNDPENILVGERSRPPDQIRQEAVEVMPAEKDNKLLEIVENETGSVLVFAATRAGTDGVYQVLKRAGQNVCVIHSGHAQRDRQKALDGFKAGTYRIMVATDVAQRGLDIEGISLVINYDLPDNTEDYIHRIGRTGRAYADGRALSLVTYHDYAALRNIEKAVGHTFQNFKRKNKTGLKRKVR
ncbi:MAG: DEAD/DEAH box helicase, partial [bacterium]